MYHMKVTADGAEFHHIQDPHVPIDHTARRNVFIIGMTANLIVWGGLLCYALT